MPRMSVLRSCLLPKQRDNNETFTVGTVSQCITYCTRAISIMLQYAATTRGMLALHRRYVCSAGSAHSFLPPLVQLTPPRNQHSLTSLLQRSVNHGSCSNELLVLIAPCDQLDTGRSIMNVVRSVWRQVSLACIYCQTVRTHTASSYSPRPSRSCQLHDLLYPQV